MIIKLCKACKAKIKVPNCLLKRKRYCSKECLYRMTKKRMKGNIYWKKTIATQFKKGHKPFILPSEQYNSWKGGCPSSKKWINWSQNVKKRDNWVCQHCGYKGSKKNKFIISHHKVHYKLAPELKFIISNGITLCRKCHPLYHPELSKKIF